LIASVEGAGFMAESFARCFRMVDDGSVLWASYGGGPALKRWDLKGPTIRISQHPEISAYFATSADGRRALVRRARNGSEDLALYELGDTPRLVTLPKFGRGVSTAVVSSDARWAATADYEHDLFVWSLDRALDPL